VDATAPSRSPKPVTVAPWATNPGLTAPRSRWVLCAPGSEQGAFRPAANLNHAERSPHVMKFLLKYEKAVDIVLVLRQHQDCKWFYAIRVITKSNPLTRHPKHT